MYDEERRDVSSVGTTLTPLVYVNVKGQETGFRLVWSMENSPRLCEKAGSTKGLATSLDVRV